MAQQISPWIEGAYGWNFGENNWNGGMDENLLKFSFLFDRNVDGVVSSLPVAVNGAAYFLTTDNRLYFSVGTTYFSTPTPKWFIFFDRSSGDTWQFNGAAAVQIDSPADLDSRLDSVELTISNLGTAAFEDISFFATPSYVDNRFTELGFVSVKEFGAVGDGVTDDQPAFEAALAASNNVYVPPGKYLLQTGNIDITGKCLWSKTGKDAAGPYGDLGAVIHTTQTTNSVFIFGKGSIIDGLQFFYPNQDGSTITDVSGYPTIVGSPIVYPPTIRTVTTGCSGFAILNTVFINSYHCMEFGDPAFVGACGRAIIHNVDAFALKHFMTVYNALGEIFVSNVDVSSIVYQDVANIGDMKLYKWRQQNADDFVLKKADGFTVSSSIFLGANRNIHVPIGQTLGLTKWENVVFDQARTVLDAESPCSNMLFDGCQIFGKTLFANEPAADLFRFRSTVSAAGLGPVTLSDTQIITALRSPFSLETANCVTRLELNNVSITAWAQATGLVGEIAAVYVDPAATGTAVIVNGGSMRSVGYATAVGISHNATTGSQVYANGTIFNGCFKSVKAVNTTQQEVINCSSGNTGSVDLDLTGATTYREKGNRWNKPPISKQDGSPWFVGRTPVAQATSGGTALTVIFGTKLRDSDVSLNATTGVFTCKTAGAYDFSTRLSHAGGTAGDVFALTIVTSLGTYENRFTMLSTAQSVDLSAVIEMRVNDTAEVRIQRISGSGVFTLNGNAGGNYFTGRLID